MLGKLGAAVLVGATVALLPAAVARADAETVCTIDDDRLTELSGLATTDDGYVTVNDSTGKDERRQIFSLGQDCQVDRTVAYPSEPTDTEDLALASDGTLWVADIGDNDLERQTIGLWKLAAGATEPVLYQVQYPDGAHNAETLVLNGDGTPIILTKDESGAQVYTLSGALPDGQIGMLRAAGSIEIPETSTDNPRDEEGRRVLTGGTNSPDGTRVAVRTYADAFEYTVTNGDVIAALTTGTPEVTALPDEPQGESIAYSQDGNSLLTVSESTKSAEKPDILRYPSAFATDGGSNGTDWVRIALYGGAGVILVGLVGFGASRFLRTRRTIG